METNTTALATIGNKEYAILLGGQSGLESVIEAMQGNLSDQITAFSLNRISMPAGAGTVWKIPDINSERSVEKITGVIIHWQDVRVYWEHEYDGSKNQPDCSSSDCKTGEGNPGGSCKTCPLGNWDANENPPICKKNRRLFILTPDEFMPILLSITPGSLGEVGNYFKNLAIKGILYSHAVTSITLEPTKSTGGIPYSKAIFERDAILNAAQIEAIKQIQRIFKPLLQQIPFDADDNEHTTSAATPAASKQEDERIPF